MAPMAAVLLGLLDQPVTDQTMTLRPSRQRHHCVTAATRTRRNKNDLFTADVHSYPSEMWGLDDQMDSLVIQIAMWCDDDGVRARLSGDAQGESTVHVATSVDELLLTLNSEVRRWARRIDSAGAPANDE